MHLAVDQRLATHLSLGIGSRHWMRWRTFEGMCERLDRYEEMLDDRLFRVVARLMAVARG